MRCSCCGSGDLTTGGCLQCFSTTICGSCGARFCTVHHREAYEKHPENCPGIIRQSITVVPAGVIIPGGQPWTKEW